MSNSHTVAYWDGREVRGFRIAGDDYSEQLEEEFDFDERTFNRLHADLVSRHASNVGYSLDSLMRASPVVNCQLIRALS
jgi:hypothetical protein